LGHRAGSAVSCGLSGRRSSPSCSRHCSPPCRHGRRIRGQTLPANLGTRIKALEKHYKDLTDDEDDSGPPKKTPSQKKKEKRERKEAKEAAEKKEKEEKKP